MVIWPLKYRIVNLFAMKIIEKVCKQGLKNSSTYLLIVE